MTEPDRPARTWRELFVASFLDGAPPDVLAWAMPRLVSATRDLRVHAGETIFRIGEPSELVYFVVSGSVRADRPGFPSWTLGERSVVGILDAVLERPRSREATAITAARLLELSVSEWFEILEDSIDTAMRTVDTIASVLVDLRRQAREAPAPAPPDAAPRPASLSLVERIVVLRRVDCLRRAGVQTLATLAAHAEEVRFEPGDAPVAIRGDARDRAMFVIAHGEMETTSGPPLTRERFGRSEMLGGAAAFVERAGFEARAAQRTVALRVSAEDWFDVMEEHFDLTRSIVMSLVAEREVLMNAVGEAPGAAEEAPMSRRGGAR